MTERAEKLLDTFNTKLNTILFLYEQGVCGFDESKTRMEEEWKNFDKCLYLALCYGLIDANEFLSLTDTTIFNTYFRKVEVLIEKHYNK